MVLDWSVIDRLGATHLEMNDATTRLPALALGSALTPLRPTKEQNSLRWPWMEEEWISRQY
jgi:hypothetical protein